MGRGQSVLAPWWWGGDNQCSPLVVGRGQPWSPILLGNGEVSLTKFTKNDEKMMTNLYETDMYEYSFEACHRKLKKTLHSVDLKAVVFCKQIPT